MYFYSTIAPRARILGEGHGSFASVGTALHPLPLPPSPISPANTGIMPTFLFSLFVFLRFYVTGRRFASIS